MWYSSSQQRQGGNGTPTAKGLKMLHTDFAINCLTNNGFHETGTVRNQDGKPCGGSYELETAKGTLRVFVADLPGRPGVAGSIVTKPNGTSKNLTDRSDGVFARTIAQTIKANN